MPIVHTCSSFYCTISRKIMTISVKAETHVIILHTTRKFVTSVTHTQADGPDTDNKTLNVLIDDDDVQHH